MCSCARSVRERISGYRHARCVGSLRRQPVGVCLSRRPRNRGLAVQAPQAVGALWPGRRDGCRMSQVRSGSSPTRCGPTPSPSASASRPPSSTRRPPSRPIRSRHDRRGHCGGQVMGGCRRSRGAPCCGRGDQSGSCVRALHDDRDRSRTGRNTMLKNIPQYIIIYCIDLRQVRARSS